jgi:hypothetical protein
MIMSSSRNVSLLLIIMFMSGLFKSGVEGRSIFQKRKVFVSMRNDLTTALTLSCHSSEDNLGAHILQTNQMFSFDFRPNFSGSTKFVCDFTWVSNNRNIIHNNLLMYQYSRDTSSGCDINCRWEIYPTNATQYGITNRTYVVFTW